MSSLTKWSLEENEYYRRRLGKLGEEMNELGQIKERILLQGHSEINPSTGKYLMDELHDEIADVYAQLDETVKAFDLDLDYIKTRREHKRSLMKKWESMYKPEKGT